MALDRDELIKLLKEKGVKSLDDFNAFIWEVSKEVVETLLEGELTDHRGYEKHDQKTKATDNARNGFTPKAVKSRFGEIDLDVPRDRKSDFEPQAVKKHQKDISGLEGEVERLERLDEGELGQGRAKGDVLLLLGSDLLTQDLVQEVGVGDVVVNRRLILTPCRRSKMTPLFMDCPRPRVRG